MSNNNIEETERLLHPETRALLSSIHTTASHYRERTTTNKKTPNTFLTTPRNFVLGGIGVATVALGSYVSGYRSSIVGLNDATTTTMRLGNEQQQQQSKKVVLHTGCSPVAQVETRWLFFLYRIIALQFRGPSLDWMMMMMMIIIIFVLCKQQQQQRVRRFGNGRKKTPSLFFFFFFFWT